MSQDRNFNVYDPVNSIYLLFVGYKYGWRNGQTSMTYGMRYANDPRYTGNNTEVNRIMNLLSQRVTAEYVSKDNPLNKVILYKNLNRGRTIQGISNQVIFEISFKDGFIKEEPYIYTQDMSHKERQFWSKLLNILVEYSRSNKTRFDTEYAQP
ncbi:hypothetical protein [Emticicia sp. BO119]|uniref:hypothetical protein n=1 Tax=Emticicia sp. BO119 TaxID=2757768 RepID=UPI0015F04F86|nr:hypothetical protein [Emticicia sp. BO119]MBA4848992.1 hypothetical protein [Emticicia sp. BO119]